MFASVDDGYGFIQIVHTESAEVYEAHGLSKLLDDVNVSRLLADNPYDTASNRDYLKESKVKNGILRKAARVKPLTARQK